MTHDSRPLPTVGQSVTVTRATYSAVPPGTVARVARIRPRRGRDWPELYELDIPDGPWLFWRWELAWSEKIE